MDIWVDRDRWTDGRTDEWTDRLGIDGVYTSKRHYMVYEGLDFNPLGLMSDF